MHKTSTTIWRYTWTLTARLTCTAIQLNLHDARRTVVTAITAVTAPRSAVAQNSMLTSSDRTNSTMVNTHPSPRSRATANDSSTTQKHTTTKSQSSMRTPSDYARQPQTGWSSTILHTETATMSLLLLLCQERKMQHLGNQHHVLRPPHESPLRPHLLLPWQQNGLDAQQRLHSRKHLHPLS